jgi:hypothetical protein
MDGAVHRVSLCDIDDLRDGGTPRRRDAVGGLTGRSPIDIPYRDRFPASCQLQGRLASDASPAACNDGQTRHDTSSWRAPDVITSRGPS